MAVTMAGKLMLLAAPVCLVLCPELRTQREGQPRIEAVRKYILENDYPEVFGETQYHARIENILDVDIDNDGANEMVVQYEPHYRQSATIVIYQISSELQVTRVTEGLAPGSLQNLSGNYLDSHELGMAIDLTLGQAQGKAEKAQDALQIFLSKFGGVVAYQSFYHMDGRKGTAAYVDMTEVDLPPGTKDCSAFEYSKVRQIAAGRLREDPGRNYLAAWVGGEIYVYQIRGISKQGMLDKKRWVLKAPTNFQGFLSGQGLSYKARSGTELLTLKAPPAS